MFAKEDAAREDGGAEPPSVECIGGKWVSSRGFADVKLRCFVPKTGINDLALLLWLDADCARGRRGTGGATSPT